MSPSVQETKEPRFYRGHNTVLLVLFLFLYVWGCALVKELRLSTD